MITLGREPEGLLLKKGDVLEWAAGLTDKQWEKIRPHLRTVRLPGCGKPFYRKNEVRAKIIKPMLEET